jgi:DNA-binding NtrC family response regulator
MAKRHILVVDDEFSLADTVANSVNGLYETICATSVAEALDRLMSEDISLILLDCVLPGETMWQVVLEADRLGVPVVLMTGDEKGVAEISDGARLHILKPFSLAGLLDVLDKAVESTPLPAH